MSEIKLKEKKMSYVLSHMQKLEGKIKTNKQERDSTKLEKILVGRRKENMRSEEEMERYWGVKFIMFLYVQIHHSV